jgi:hypothetical protein
VFENRLLIIFEPKSDELTGGWRKLHNEGIHNLYSSPNIIRTVKRMRWVEHVAHMGNINEFKIFVGKSYKKRPLGGLGIDGSIILTFNV